MQRAPDDRGATAEDPIAEPSPPLPSPEGASPELAREVRPLFRVNAAQVLAAPVARNLKGPGASFRNEGGDSCASSAGDGSLGDLGPGGGYGEGGYPQLRRGRLSRLISFVDANQRYGFPYCLARSQRLPYHRKSTSRLTP